MALCEAPITPTVCCSVEGSILARRGGFKAGSSPISLISVTGRGPVVGDEPVHKTSRSEEIVEGPGNFSSGDVTVTLQLSVWLLSADVAQE